MSSTLNLLTNNQKSANTKNPKASTVIVIPNMKDCTNNPSYECIVCSVVLGKLIVYLNLDDDGVVLYVASSGQNLQWNTQHSLLNTKQM